MLGLSDASCVGGFEGSLGQHVVVWRGAACVIARVVVRRLLQITGGHLRKQA